MARKKNTRKRTAAEQSAASVPSPTLLAARLRSGAGKHTQGRPRSVEKRRAIAEAS